MTQIRYGVSEAMLPAWPQVISIIAICAFSFILGNWIGGFKSETPMVVLHEVQSMDACVKQVTQIIDPNASINSIGKSVALRAIQDTCYDKGYKQAELNEYQIRRMQFFEQYYGARVILWMVVFITSSGVVLAGLQLALSYRLTLFGRGSAEHSSEMTIERSKIVLKSSTMGIFILVISLGFFFIFVTRMYPAKEISLDNHVAPQTQGSRPGSDVASPSSSASGGVVGQRPSTATP